MTSLPSSTARLELPVSGKAAPESTITIYEGTQVLGQARANVLGTWSGSIILPDVAGDHTVYAHVAFPDGGSLRSQDYVVCYVPETDEVETLTVTNQVHSTDNTGEHDRDYYTFWPDLPTLEFRVEFVKDASAISRVKVVTTDRMGEEMEIPLRYQAAKDAWVGAQDFTEYNISYHFRVEFLPGGEKQADQSLEGEYTYDAAGNLLTETRDDKTARYTWNKYGQLVGYTDFDGTEYEYSYDVFGLRNRVTVNRATTTYLNNPLGYGMPVASYGAAGEQHYVLSNALAAIRSGGSTYYYHSNLLGSVTEITGSGGAAVNPYTYDQEGSVVSRRESIANPFTYAGIYGLVADGNGLIYDRARYVSAATDSFISKDPAGTRYDSNLSRYLGNDPVNNVDPTGEFAVRFGHLIPKMMSASKNTAKSKMITPQICPWYRLWLVHIIMEKRQEILNKVVIIPIVLIPGAVILPLVSSPASAGELDGGDFTGGAAPIPDPDDLPDEIPDVPEDKPDGNDENSTPPWLKAMDNPVVDHLYSWAIGTPCWWIVLPVCGGAYTAEKWPDNPITKTGGWLGDMVGLMLYPDPDPDEWSDMILDPPPVDPSTLADKVDPSKGRGPVTNLKLYPWKLQPDNKETSEWICTYDAPKPVQLDPSGYVYEGIPSNRLSGVTAQTVQITWNGAALAGTF